MNQLASINKVIIGYLAYYHQRTLRDFGFLPTLNERYVNGKPALKQSILCFQYKNNNH